MNKLINTLINVLVLNIIISTICFAQNVGINDDNSSPDSSAMLDIKSSDKGVLVPRVQLDDVNTAAPVSNPATGLLIYANSASSVTEGFYYWDGTKWVGIASGNEDGDGDSDNELLISAELNGTTLQLSDAGGTKNIDLSSLQDGTGTDDQNLVLTGDVLTIENGTGTVDLSNYVDDADSDPTNELQTISKSGNTVTLSNGGGSFTDDDIDADADPNNEIQSLSLDGSNLSISGGNSVTLPSSGGFADTDQAYLYETADWFGNSFVDLVSVTVTCSSGQQVLLMYSCDCISSPGGGTIVLEIQSLNQTERSVYCEGNGSSYPASGQILIAPGSGTFTYTLRVKNFTSGYSGKVRRGNLTAIVN